MTALMFDTNTVSDIIRADETVLKHLETLDPRQVLSH